ncbi:YeeE/YedE family protein [Bdellovibrio sp. KM01]|uniref:YeeE/YedE family protein n=1 Tax=Bdellovibrio sp. KM01 TaxID=2748865 RepID=UPI0021068990|nr:YeeE/YedE family protein [Bdellovibrio sp. KM01]
MKRQHVQAGASFIVGLIFALGLGISGMTQPQKVIGFLQLGQGWDPSLMFVMLGAIPVNAVVYFLIRRKTSPLLDTRWHVPTSREITKPLMIGSALFGFGWALGGYCPGPALTSLGAGSRSAILFVVFMFLGMILQRGYQRWIKS